MEQSHLHKNERGVAREEHQEEEQIKEKYTSAINRPFENEQRVVEENKEAQVAESEPWNHNPTINEIAVSASASYVRVLLDSIKNQQTFVEDMTCKIESLSAEREAYKQCEGALINEQAEELRLLRTKVHELGTCLQREEEKSKRLLHENTVLYTQLLEHREQLANLERLARERALRLREKGLNVNSNCNNNKKVVNHNKVNPKSFSIRAAVEQYMEPSDNLQHYSEFYHHYNNNSHNKKRVYKNVNNVNDRDNTLESEVHTLSSSLRNKLRSHVDPQVQKSLPFFYKQTECNSESNVIESNAERDTHVSNTSESENNNNNTESKDDEDEREDNKRDVEVMRACVPSASSRGARILALTEEVEALCECLDAQRIYYEKMRGDLIAQGDEVERTSLLEGRQLREQNNKLEKQQEELMKEFIALRQLRDHEAQLMHGREDWLRRGLQEALNTAEALRTRNHVDVKTVEEQIKSKYYPRLARLQHELMHRRNITAQEMNKYEVALEHCRHQRDELKRKWQEEKEHRRRDEERHRLAMEGIRSELDGMRQTMRLLEKKVYFAQFRENHTSHEWIAPTATVMNSPNNCCYSSSSYNHYNYNNNSNNSRQPIKHEYTKDDNTILERVEQVANNSNTNSEYKNNNKKSSNTLSNIPPERNSENKINSSDEHHLHRHHNHRYQTNTNINRNTNEEQAATNDLQNRLQNGKTKHKNNKNEEEL